MRDSKVNQLMEELTDRQKAILFLLYTGKTEKEIATIMKVHENNIKRHARIITATATRVLN